MFRVDGHKSKTGEAVPQAGGGRAAAGIHRAQRKQSQERRLALGALAAPGETINAMSPKASLGL